jgi:TolA-binding protein
MTKNKKHEDGFQEVEETLTRTEQFLENHLNLVLYIIAGIIILVLLVLGIQRFYITPRNVEAQELMYPAQNHFNNNEFDLAVNGDGVSLGFLDIIDSYGMTKAAKLAKYYTGVSYLHLGEYETAINYLKKFDTDDLLLEPLSNSAIGDAYVELGQYDKAIAAYNKALKSESNSLTSPAIMTKLALAYEANNQTDKAIEVLQNIKTEYPNNSEIANVEKHIARLQQL